MKTDFGQHQKPIDIRTIDIPKITDWKIFELLCRDLWKNEPNKFEHVDINGRKGQKQDGVDIYGRHIESGEWFGLSCKVREDSLKESDVRSDIIKAKDFVPKLTEYYFVTTASKDAKIQKIIRGINDSKTYDFSIEIIFWEDIKDKLQNSQNIDIFFKNYHAFFVDNTNFGYSIGKLLSLHLGVEGDYDTTYELMIGRIPGYKDKEPTSQDYYRGIYYITNLNDRTIEFFNCKLVQDKEKPKCFPSDIEMAFKNEYDCWRISEWLFSMNDISKIIYSDEDHFYFSITAENLKLYLQSCEEG